MAHLIATVRDCSIPEAIGALRSAHHFLATRARTALARVPAEEELWGIRMKRVEVELGGVERPVLIEKSAEKFAEVVNMLASVERLLAALQWFAEQPQFDAFRVAVCHPSTSSGIEDNDLVLTDHQRLTRVRCEVCDVVSGSAGQNGKEKKDLMSLGCEADALGDGVRRFICTSAEFATALASNSRKWDRIPFRYRRHDLGDSATTVLLEIIELPAHAAS